MAQKPRTIRSVMCLLILHKCQRWDHQSEQYRYFFFNTKSTFHLFWLTFLHTHTHILPSHKHSKQYQYKWISEFVRWTATAKAIESFGCLFHCRNRSVANTRDALVRCVGANDDFVIVASIAICQMDVFTCDERDNNESSSSVQRIFGFYFETRN